MALDSWIGDRASGRVTRAISAYQCSDHDLQNTLLTILEQSWQQDGSELVRPSRTRKQSSRSEALTPVHPPPSPKHSLPLAAQRPMKHHEKPTTNIQ